MAKQKAKIPAAPSGLDAAGGEAVVAARIAPGRTAPKRKAIPKLKAVPKRKVKNARKVKGRAVAEAGVPEAARLPVRPKALRKATRKKGQAVAAPVASTDTLVAKVFESFQGALPVVGRARKAVRPAAPLGRLERLEIAIEEVRVGGRASVRPRKLLASGVAKMAQKVIEEAAETAIEAIRGDRVAFVNESVDLFYNFLALASEIGVPLSAVWAEMDRREVALGMAEKLPKAPDA